MTQVQLEVDLTEWFIQGTFLAAVLFALVYIPFFKWRETVTGRATTVLVLAIAGALLHSTLIVWGVVGVSVAKNSKPVPGNFINQFFTWLSIVSIGAAGLSIVILTWQAGRFMLIDTDSKFLKRMFMIH